MCAARSSFSPQRLSRSRDAPRFLLAASCILGLGGGRPAAVYLTGDFPNNLGCPGKSALIQLVWGCAARAYPSKIQPGSPENTLGGKNRVGRGTIYTSVFPVSGLGLTDLILTGCAHSGLKMPTTTTHSPFVYAPAPLSAAEEQCIVPATK